MIDAHDVTKWYGARRAVDTVSFRVDAGDSVALWGSNGAGKTTLLRCLLGMTRFDGQITVAGFSPARDGKEVRRRIGYVPQIMPVFDLKVGELVRFVARLRDADPRQAFDQLEAFELATTTSQPVNSLSGGMKQKLALTLALLGNPPILFLDEPTANLDSRSQVELISMLSDLNHQGRTIVFTTHRWSEVRALANRNVTLEAGKQVLGETLSATSGLNGSVNLRVNVAPESIEPSVRLLGRHGFTAIRNGHSILISVAGQRKAEPLTILARSDVVVSDFDLEAES